MMLHKPSGQSLGLKKGFKFHKAFQAALLLTMCIWLLYQIKHSDDTNNPIFNDPITKTKIKKELATMLIGRKSAAKIVVGSVTKRFEGVHEELPSEAGQDFPANWIENAWGRFGSHEGRGGGMEMGGNSVKEKVKIEQEDANEQEHEIEMDGFQYFHDENGVPPEELNTR